MHRTRNSAPALVALLVLALAIPLTGCSKRRAASRRKAQMAQMAGVNQAPLSPRAEIQMLNDQWAEFCQSVVASRNYRAIGPRLSSMFTVDFVAIDTEGNRREGIDAAIEGTSEFLSAMHRLSQATIVVEDVQGQPDGAVQVITSFDWRWESRDRRSRRLEQVHNVGRERAQYIRTAGGWRIFQSEVLSSEFLDE